jgi:deoxyribonuclease V
MDIAALRDQQRQRAAEVVCQDDFEVMPPRLIGGARGLACYPKMS